jgi:hypothetical protein
MKCSSVDFIEKRVLTHTASAGLVKHPSMLYQNKWDRVMSEVKYEQDTWTYVHGTGFELEISGDESVSSSHSPACQSGGKQVLYALPSLAGRCSGNALGLYSGGFLFESRRNNCQTVINIWLWAPDGARHQDRLTDWPSVVTWLWLWRCK